MIITEWPAHCNNENSRQGYWGELYVKRLFQNQGYIVVLNPDPFGGWDMVRIDPVTGKSTSIQVKTLIRYVTKNYFGISSGPTGNAFNNIKLCDELILVVRNPTTIDDKQYKGKVIKVKNHKKFTIYNNQYIIPSNIENFEELAQLTKEELDIVNSFNTAKRKYNGKRIF